MCFILEACSKLYQIICLVICLVITIPIIIVVLYFYQWSKSDVDTGYWLVNDNQIVAKERDVVAYFNLSESDNSVKGDEDFTTTWDDVIWYFDNDINRISFISNPQKYAPRFGGYDALSIGLNGDKKKIDPNDWVVYNDRLYLFYDDISKNTWNNQKNQLIISGLSQWCDKYKDSYECTSPTGN